MGWAIGHDTNWDRTIGYGVPAYCDHPGCGAEIDRGLGYVCGGDGVTITIGQLRKARSALTTQRGDGE